jgi:hypothetical protein
VQFFPQDQKVLKKGESDGDVGVYMFDATVAEDFSESETAVLPASRLSKAIV